jgi:hypothetical protein
MTVTAETDISLSVNKTPARGRYIPSNSGSSTYVSIIVLLMYVSE